MNKKLNSMRKRIVNQMKKDGFSEYNSFGKVDKDTSAKWAEEFKRRMAKYND